jgi:hypothetical protein
MRANFQSAPSLPLYSLQFLVEVPAFSFSLVVTMTIKVDPLYVTVSRRRSVRRFDVAHIRLVHTWEKTKIEQDSAQNLWVGIVCAGVLALLFVGLAIALFKAWIVLISLLLGAVAIGSLF